MPLPVGSCADDIPSHVCCSTIWDIAERLRCVLTDALCGCIDPACADKTFRSYISLGPTIEDPIGDSLIVHMPRIATSFNSTTPQGALLGVAVHLADFEIRLLEAGWPMIELNEAEETFYVPDSGMVNAVSKHLYSHGELMYRTLVSGVQLNTLFATFENVGMVQLSDFVPIQPEGELAGWVMAVRVEIIFPPYIFAPGS